LDERIIAGSDTSIVIEFGDCIDRQLNARVLAAHSAIQNAGLLAVTETVPTFRSLMVHYDPLITGAKALIDELRPLLSNLGGSIGAARLWDLPACYGGDNGPDLDFVSQAAGITATETIRLHSQETYHVYMIGFLPGYPYMGDVAASLQLPRRENPRTRVPKGAIAIAKSMTAIYPLESPGGWHLIGRTPISLFTENISQPALLAPGDKVRFFCITSAEYLAIEADLHRGTYSPSCTGISP